MLRGIECEWYSEPALTRIGYRRRVHQAHAGIVRRTGSSMPAASSSTAAYTQYFTVLTGLNCLNQTKKVSQPSHQIQKLHQGKHEEGGSEAGEW